MAFVALGFFSLIFHFGKSPPLSIKPEVHRVGEKTESPANRNPQGDRDQRGSNAFPKGNHASSRAVRYSSQ